MELRNLGLRKIEKSCPSIFTAIPVSKFMIFNYSITLFQNTEKAILFETANCDVFRGI